MFRFQIVVFFWLAASIGYANENQTCFNSHESFAILGKAFIDQPWGTDKSLKKAYMDLLKSGLIEYGSERPIVYSTNISFTDFFKRICHDETCDFGDTTETLNICVKSTNEYCRLIAATKGDDLYCLLSPLDGWVYENPYDPFK